MPSKYVKAEKIRKELAVQFDEVRKEAVTQLDVRVTLRFKMHGEKELERSPKRRRLEQALDEAVREIARDVVRNFRINVVHNIQSEKAYGHTDFPPLARGRHPERADFADAYINSVKYRPGPKGKAYVVASGEVFDLVEYGFAVTRPPLSGDALFRIKQWIQLKDILWQFLPEKYQEAYEKFPEKWVKRRLRDEDDYSAYSKVFGRSRRKRKKFYETASPIYSSALDAAAKRVAMIIYNKSPYPPRYIFRLAWLSYKADKQRRARIVEEKLAEHRVKTLGR